MNKNESLDTLSDDVKIFFFDTSIDFSEVKVFWSGLSDDERVSINTEYFWMKSMSICI